MTRTVQRAQLRLDQLHGSLSDPLLDVMNYLNEVTSRYPSAISFGPGRPFDGFFDTAHIGRYLGVYERYLREEQAFDEAQVTTALFQYGRTNGMIHDLVARTVANDEGIVVDPAHLVITVGAQEGMLLTLRALMAEPNDVLLVPDPGYVGITGAARVLDIATAAVPEGPSGVDAEAVRRVAAEVRATGRRPRALYVVPDFANPSGASLSVAARRELLDAAAQEDLVLLEDNPYGFFERVASTRPTLKSLDVEGRVIYLGSFAKTCFPGARVGYVIADQPVLAADGTETALADELSKIKSMVTVNTPAVTQAVIGGMLIEHDCALRPATGALVEHYRQAMTVLLAALQNALPSPQVRWNVPAGGFFLVLTVPFEVDDVFLEESARDHGVIWTPMRYFHLGPGGEHDLRLSISSLTAALIEEGVRRLAGHITERLAR